LAALAGVWFLLLGGANALAQTVWCVPNTSISTLCTSGYGEPRIQTAVNDASSGDIVLVGPGYYHETVEVDTQGLIILGAQAGHDAREGRHNVSRESVVDASAGATGSGAGAGFDVETKDVVIDGFTIQGATTANTYTAGIYVDESDVQILNNIIQNNAVGVFLYYGNSTIQYNLFKTNNYGTPETEEPYLPGPGFGVAGYDDSGASITDNAFTGNKAAAVWFDTYDALSITNNTSEKDGSFLVLYETEYVTFSRNQGRDFGANGRLAVWGDAKAEAAIYLFSTYPTYNDRIFINDNDLEGGKSTGYNGIDFSILGGTYYNCEYCTVNNNKICNFAGNGIVAEGPGSSPTLFYSIISRNLVRDNGKDGILMENASDNQYNYLFENKAQGNGVKDCEDDSSDSFTAGTANIWSFNFGPVSLPAGICSSTGLWH